MTFDKCPKKKEVHGIQSDVSRFKEYDRFSSPVCKITRPNEYKKSFETHPAFFSFSMTILTPKV